MTDLVIVGDEAWTAEEYEAAERKRAQRRAYYQIHARHIAEYQKAYRATHREQQRTYRRRWRLTRLNPDWADAVGFLHELGCKGGHYQARKACTPIAVYTRPYERAA